MSSQVAISVGPDEQRWRDGGLDFPWLEITRKCDLRCVHCYTEASAELPLRGSMTRDDWRRILEEGFAAGCRAVQFIGGEPTLHPDLPDFIADAKSVGYEFIEVFTNGTVMNDAVMRALEQFQVNLAFSVYADDASAHDAVTAKKGSFSKTIGNIRNAVRRGLKVRAGIIAMDGNAEKVEGTRALLKDLGVTSVGVDRVRGIGRGGDFVPHHDPLSELCGSCWKGKLRIDPDGRVSPCVFSGFYNTGNAKDGLANIMSGAELREFRSQMRTKELERGWCMPNMCHPETCRPATGPCVPDCAPSCNPCVPDLR